MSHAQCNINLTWRGLVVIFLLYMTRGSVEGFCLDMCMFGDICHENFTCKATAECKASCICDNSTRDCPDCPCVHGECSYSKDGTLDTCICEHGWTGSTCDFNCPCVHGECLYDGEGNFDKCRCKQGWSGLKCNTTCNLVCDSGYVCSVLDGSGSFITCIPVTTVAPVTTPPVATYNVCDAAYVRRPASERTCYSGEYDCHNGRCISNSTGAVWCICDPGGFGAFCIDTCCLDCGEHGTCYEIFETAEKVCNCNEYYTGTFCEIYDPPTVAPPLQTEKPNWYWWVVGTCIFVLVLLLVLLVVVPYVMWKHRVILIMKVVHYFQGYEDDDEREWDAFISYKGNTPDEDFVVRTLFPKLAREMGFNINVHFKDFVPGEEITHGIINAIENSRRTIMVVSPHYLTSSWTKFEWQMAQQKMLEKKHRIIPILFDDISQQETSMDTNLKLILNSVTYIEWPRSGTPKQIDKFWKRIELSMPKMRCRQMSPTNQNGHVSQNNKANGEPIFTRSPDSIDLGISGNYSNQTSITELSSSGKSDYNTINEIEMLGEEEVYDTLNEREMEPGQFSGRDVEKGKDDGDHYDKLEAGPLRGGKIETLETKPDFRANDGTIANEMKAKEHEYLNILNVRL